MNRVLYVEDNEDNVYMLKMRLELIEGFEIAVAKDGAEAISCVAADRPDIILMDLNVPVLNGWEATRRLKADAKTAHIPIIALTAHAMTSDRDKALAAGCDDFDTKPIDFERLLTKMRRLLASRQPPNPFAVLLRGVNVNGGRSLNRCWSPRERGGARDRRGGKSERPDFAAVFKLLGELTDIVGQVEASNDPAFGTTGAKLRDALGALDRASRWLLERLPTAPNDALAGATPYLRLFGSTLGGCMLAGEALAAKSNGDAGDPQRYVTVARFFAENITVQAGSLEKTVTESSDAVNGADTVLLG